MTDTVDKQISKLRYQIGLLKPTLDSDQFPLEALILDLDYSEEDADNIQRVFAEYQEKVESGEKFSHVEFEHACGLHYQTLKRVVNVFAKNAWCTDACFTYIKGLNTVPVEYHKITRSEAYKKWSQQHP